MSDGRQIECWFLKFQSDVRDRESLQQDRKHCQFASWVRHVFPASLSCLELGAPSEASGGFSNFNRTLGSGELANRTGNTANSRLGFGAFFLLPFFSKKPNLAARGYKRRHT